MFTIAAPATRERLDAALQQIENDSVAYWNTFATEAFFAPLGGGWSPAENVRHLAKSVRAVTKGLKMPRLVVRFLFGAPRRPSESYEELRARYATILEKGANAGRFAPSQRQETDLEAWRTQIMEQFTTANRELRTALTRWPDKSLDRHQMPHPLLGKLTVREMLCFTAYHQLHHMDGVKRKVAAAGGHQ
ncbi:MAG TPA: DinB family protein [Thermoanaerobaculia bacterium]